MTNVLNRALATENPELIADTRALAGSMLEQLNRPAEALAAYEPNLQKDVSPKWRAQALARVVDLAQASGGPASALQKLELLSSQQLDEPARDLVQLTMGELRLRLFRDLPPTERSDPARYSPAASNHLFGALRHFTNLVTVFTNSPYAGKAWLDRGWCHWELAQWPDAATAFAEASRRLASGVDRAKAVFKLGDSQFQLAQFDAALTNYARVAREFGDVPEVKEGLLDQAYYQMIQSAIRTGNQAEAESAVNALLAQFPGNFYAERGLLLVGQFLIDVRNPARSRDVLENFSNRFQDSILAPERERAIARTFELEENWPEAVAIYDRWLARFTNHVSRPVAEFDRAFALSQAGNLTNALAGFTNFVSHYPENPLTPKALVWIGNHYDNHQEYAPAEFYYQLLFSGPYYTNWPVTRLTYQARIFASRSAFQRQLYGDAKSYLTKLLNLTPCAAGGDASAVTNCCPRDIYAEGLFAFGDVFSADPAQEEVQRFGTARTAFERLVNEFPESPLVPSALGRMGEVNLQLGAFEGATNAFLACMNHPEATVSDRSRAELGLGRTFERLAESRPASEQAPLLVAAREHYLNVFYQRNLDNERGEIPDNTWIQQACELAARLAIRQQEWANAARLYERLREMLPVLEGYYDGMIRQLNAKARGG